MEKWLPIKGFELYYEVSSLGRIKRIKGNRKYNLPEKILSVYSSKKRHGYCYVKINPPRAKKLNLLVHRIVAGTFIPNPNNYPIINHINFITNDNRVENLEWCTIKHNVNHSKHRRPDLKGKFGCMVAAYDLSGNEIGIYGSIRDAGRKLGVHGQNICAQLSGSVKLLKGMTFKRL